MYVENNTIDEFMELWNSTYLKEGVWSNTPHVNIVCVYKPNTYEFIYGEYHPETDDGIASPVAHDVHALFKNPNNIKRIVESGNSTFLMTPDGSPTFSLTISPISSSVDKGAHGYLIWGLESWSKAKVLATSK